MSDHHPQLPHRSKLSPRLSQSPPSLISPIESHFKFPAAIPILNPLLLGFLDVIPVSWTLPESSIRTSVSLSPGTASQLHIPAPPSRPLPASPLSGGSPHLHVSPTPQSPPKESPPLGFQTSAFPITYRPVTPIFNGLISVCLSSLLPIPASLSAH